MAGATGRSPRNPRSPRSPGAARVRPRSAAPGLCGLSNFASHSPRLLGSSGLGHLLLPQGPEPEPLCLRSRRGAGREPGSRERRALAPLGLPGPCPGAGRPRAWTARRAHVGPSLRESRRTAVSSPEAAAARPWPGEGQQQVTGRPGAINRGARQPRAGAAAGARGWRAGAAAGRAAAWALGGSPAAAGALADGPGPGTTARTTGPCGPPAPPAAATCSACGPRPGESRPAGRRALRREGRGPRLQQGPGRAQAWGHGQAAVALRVSHGPL